MTPISDFVRDVAKTDRAAALAFFLMDMGEGVCGKVRVRMSASDQRALFGTSFGRGLLIIDGATESVKAVVSVAYGTDWDCVVEQPWFAIARGKLIRDNIMRWGADTSRYPHLKEMMA